MEEHKHTLDLDTNNLIKEAIKYCQEDPHFPTMFTDSDNLIDYIHDFLWDYLSDYVDDFTSEMDYHSVEWEDDDLLINTFKTIEPKLIKELEKKKLLPSQEEIKENNVKSLNEEIKELQKLLKNKKEELKELKGE